MPISLRVHDPSQGPVWDEAWAVTDAMLAELARFCESRGVRFGVMLIPDESQVSPTARQRLQTQWPQSTGWDLAVATQRVSGMVGKHSAVFDLQPILTGDGRGLYFPVDGHWTSAGHAAAGRAAAPWVSSLLQ